MTAKRNNNLIFTYVLYILLTAGTFLFISCRTISIKDNLIGNTSIERKFYEKGELIYYKKTNSKLKWSELGYATHQFYITRTTIKMIKDHKTVELNFQKAKPDYTALGYEVLKSKRVIWNENRKKTLTRTSSK